MKNISFARGIFLVFVLIIVISLPLFWLFASQDWVEVEGTILGSEDVQWVEIEATITGDEGNGTGWFEDFHEWSEEYCDDGDCWTDWYQEYECYADLFLTWEVNGTAYQDWAYSPSIVSERYCLELIEDYYQIDNTVTLEYNPEDPADYQIFTIEHGAEKSTLWRQEMYHWIGDDAVQTQYHCIAELVIEYEFENVTYQSDSDLIVQDEYWDDGLALLVLIQSRMIIQLVEMSLFL